MAVPRKKSLDDMLGEGETTPQIQRGQGYQLSTDTPNPNEDITTTPTESERRNAETQKRIVKPPEPVRTNRGFQVRVDLVKACKRIAFEEERKLYEVVEEALEEYIDRRKRHSGAESGQEPPQT